MDFDTREREKLIVTVAADGSLPWPNNPHCPSYDEYDREAYIDAFVDEYVGAVEAGAAVCHIHGVREMQEAAQEDGSRLPVIDYDGWAEMAEGITDRVDTVMQYGIAAAPIPQTKRLLEQGPDMKSYSFHAHDLFFNPVWADEYEPTEIAGLHTREDMREFADAAQEHGVKPDIEVFHLGSTFNIREVREEGLLDDPVHTTLFFGWPGGNWSPATPRELMNRVDHLPENVNWTVSCMDPPRAWDLMATAIVLGGHVRIGWEDNPYLYGNDLSQEGIAESNAELVEKVATLSRELGREVATPDEAREILGLE